MCLRKGDEGNIPALGQGDPNELGRFSSITHRGQTARGTHLALAGLWWDAKGDWTRAHESAQQDEGPEGSWAHAYLHRKEGDQDNAAYWYRPHSKAGVVVLCSPVLTSRVVGVQADTQKALYAQIVETLLSETEHHGNLTKGGVATQPGTLDEFLDQHEENGIAFLLSFLLNGPSPKDIVKTARSTLGVALNEERAHNMVSMLPRGIAESDIIAKLQERGWTAYLRRLITDHALPASGSGGG